MLPGLNAPVTLATRTGNGVWVDNGPWTGYSRAVREHPNIVEIPKRTKQSLFFTGCFPMVGCLTLVLRPTHVKPVAEGSEPRPISVGRNQVENLEPRPSIITSPNITSSKKPAENMG